MKPGSKTEAWLSWVIALVLPTACFFGIFYGLGDGSLKWWINSLFVPSGLIILVIIQIYIHRSGLFDVPLFAFRRFFESWRNPLKKKYDQASDYHEAMMEKRSANKPYTLPFFIVGGIFVAASLVLSLVEATISA
jgi:hypothetical protein